MDKNMHKLETRRERGVGVSTVNTDEGGQTHSRTTDEQAKGAVSAETVEEG
jgi:hypothetical protein